MVYRELQQGVAGVTRLNGAANTSMEVTFRDPSKVAVLLNRNARRVNDNVAKEMEAIVGRGHVYYSRSLEEAETYAREIVQQGYGTVVCGGGDGTLMQGYNMVARYVNESNAWRKERFRRFAEPQQLLPIPRFAFVALGTGNALRRVVGAQDPLTDLRAIVENGPRKVHEVAMIERGDDRFTFGGIGYDSMLLNDYNWLKKHAGHQLLKPVVQTVTGYFGAVFRAHPAACARQTRALGGSRTGCGPGLLPRSTSGRYRRGTPTWGHLARGALHHGGRGHHAVFRLRYARLSLRWDAPRHDAPARRPFGRPECLKQPARPSGGVHIATAKRSSIFRLMRSWWSWMSRCLFNNPATIRVPSRNCACASPKTGYNW